jgi:type III restriction enzyme
MSTRNILEVTGERKRDKEAKTATARTLWVPAVNHHGGLRWAFLEVSDPYDDVVELIRATIAHQTVPAEDAA